MELLRSHHLNAWMFYSCVGFAEMRIILPGGPRNASIDSNSLIKNIRRMHSVFSTQTLSYAVYILFRHSDMVEHQTCSVSQEHVEAGQRTIQMETINITI
jgi:hypothetical protein